MCGLNRNLATVGILCSVVVFFSLWLNGSTLIRIPYRTLTDAKNNTRYRRDNIDGNPMIFVTPGEISHWVLRNKDNAKQKHFAEKYIGNLHVKAGNRNHTYTIYCNSLQFPRCVLYVGMCITFTHEKESQSEGIGVNCDDNEKVDLSKRNQTIWLYLYGDSTTRQLMGSVIEENTGNVIRNRELKEYVREKCMPQVEAANYKPNHQFGGAPCYKNERTCHMNFEGKGMKLTYDWKHFPLEPHDSYLFGKKNSFFSNVSRDVQKKTYIITGMGLHLCSHTTTPTGRKNLTHEKLLESDIHTYIHKAKSTFKGDMILLPDSKYKWGTENHHYDQERCMNGKALALNRAARQTDGVHVVDRAKINLDSSNINDNWAMHRSAFVTLVTWQHIKALINTLEIMKAETNR